MLTVWQIAGISMIALLSIGNGAIQSQPPNNAPQIQAKEKPNGSVQDQKQIKARDINPVPSSPAVNLTIPNDNNATKNTQHGDEQGTEFWSPLTGINLKITDSLLVLFTLVLAIFTGLLWSTTKKLWKEAINSSAISKQSADAATKSAEVAQKALTTTAKAIIFNSHIHAVAGLSQKAGMAVVDWTFYVIWKNTGTTPTRHLHMHTNWKPFDTEMPADFDFPDLGPPPPIRPKIVIGPDATTLSGECVIPIDVLIDASEKKKRVYLWGWVEYTDVFDAATRHRTECCIEIVVAGDPRVAHAPGDISSPNIPFLYRGGAQFNGMDDECYRQPKKYPPG